MVIKEKCAMTSVRIDKKNTFNPNMIQVHGDAPTILRIKMDADMR